MNRVDEIRERAERALPGPWQWFGNTETDGVYLATTHGGRIYVLGASIERQEGYWRYQDPYGFITVDEYERLGADERSEYTYGEKSTLHLGFPARGGGVTRSHRELARYEVLNGKTREEAGLAPGADRTNSALYREDFIGLDSAEAEFIAHAREDIDFLLGEVARLQESERVETRS